MKATAQPKGELVTPPVSPVYKAVVTLLLMAIPLSLVACSACSVALSYVIPISQSDLDNSSWLGFSPMGFSHLLKGMGAVFIFMLVMNAIVQRFSAALVSCVVAMFLFGASSTGTSLRLGVLQGDARVGCFAYQSLECRKMLGAPIDGAESIYAANTNGGGEDRYAPWYQAVRASIKSQLRSSTPSAIPGIQFIKSPWILAHASEINAKLDEQRASLKVARSTSAP